ncbi:hypothetical protein EDB80DRAFT_777966 [Ilyonectria destructans]|nr:hypothetical protein EDB80DRAFT_777966 [Ilyonectria destructans]
MPNCNLPQNLNQLSIKSLWPSVARIGVCIDGRLAVKSLVESLKELTPGEDWTVTEEDTVVVQAKPDEALSRGIFDFENVERQLPGLKECSEAEMKAVAQIMSLKHKDP